MSVERKAGGLRCGEVIALLSEYVDGELGATDVVRVEDHLRGCTVCETFGGRFARTVESIRATLGGERGVPPELLASIVARLR
jgi:predicted anti-sigma-YlaC factor YlaD